jgi:AAA15 family ATPase/GTPase
VYIKQIAISNYRNFGDPPFILELKSFTIILGENNIGKTNLLNAIGLIFGQDISVMRRRFLELDDINYSAVQKFKSHVIKS